MRGRQYSIVLYTSAVRERTMFFAAVNCALWSTGANLSCKEHAITEEHASERSLVLRATSKSTGNINACSASATRARTCATSVGRGSDGAQTA